MAEAQREGSRCILVGAAQFDEDAFRSVFRDGDTVVAVDGGFESLVRCGIEPAATIGDFDSLGYVPQAPCVLRYPCEKDASDLDLALEWAREGGFSRIAVFGALGGRLDQSIATLQALYGAALLGSRVFAVGDGCCVAVVLGGAGDVCGPGVLELPAGLSGTVSVFSLCDASEGVCETGLAYGLEDAVLTNTTSWGLSNEFTGEASRISVERGALAVFLPKSAAGLL